MTLSVPAATVPIAAVNPSASDAAGLPTGVSSLYVVDTEANSPEAGITTSVGCLSHGDAEPIPLVPPIWNVE